MFFLNFPDAGICRPHGARPRSHPRTAISHNNVTIFCSIPLQFSDPTVTPSLVSDGGVGVATGHWPQGSLGGWPQDQADGGVTTGAPGGSGQASPTNRLKRLTNTDSVYTMCQTPDGPKFQCAMCARVFNLKCTLLRHVRHQHQGRFVPHPCKSCGQVFKRTDHLKVHMKKIHNITIAPTPQSNPSPNLKIELSDLKIENPMSVSDQKPSP